VFDAVKDQRTDQRVGIEQQIVEVVKFDGDQDRYHVRQLRTRIIENRRRDVAAIRGLAGRERHIVSWHMFHELIAAARLMATTDSRAATSILL